jgi:hypothetical protein
MVVDVAYATIVAISPVLVAAGASHRLLPAIPMRGVKQASIYQ